MWSNALTAVTEADWVCVPGTQTETARETPSFARINHPCFFRACEPFRRTKSRLPSTSMNEVVSSLKLPYITHIGSSAGKVWAKGHKEG